MCLCFRVARSYRGTNALVCRLSHISFTGHHQVGGCDDVIEKAWGVCMVRKGRGCHGYAVYLQCISSFLLHVPSPLPLFLIIIPELLIMQQIAILQLTSSKFSIFVSHSQFFGILFVSQSEPALWVDLFIM